MPNRTAPSVFLRHFLFYGVALAAIGAATACTARYDWREVRGTEEPFVVLLPAKPDSSARTINLNGNRLMMRMTAAQVEGATFAVGSATLADANAAPTALATMKRALVNNINGTIRSEASSAAARTNGSHTDSISVEASGTVGAGRERQPAYLKARFVSRDRRVYQAVIISKGQPVAPEVADTFFSSFKVD
jgi:hypothetical protein